MRICWCWSFFSYAKRKKQPSRNPLVLFCTQKNDAKNKRERCKALTFPHVAQKRFDTGDLGRAEALSNTETERTTDYYHSNANWMTQNSRNVLGITPWNSQLTQAFPQKRQPGILYHTSVIQITQTEWRKTESSLRLLSRYANWMTQNKKRIIKDGML